jgi:hypothetical protein
MSSKRKLRRRKPHRAYEIVYGPMQTPSDSLPSPEARAAMPNLHALVNEDPDAAVPELLAWIEREPLPMFFNWLSAAYGSIGDEAALEETVRENYRRNPRYLFARVNYAELCLRNRDLAGAREALGESLDLQFLLGARKRVHISEAVGYLYAVALYQIEAGDSDAAAITYDTLRELAPDEPPTERLRRLLYPGFRDIFLR